MNVLWTAGTEYLVALQVSGTDAEPILKEQLKINLPTRNAHVVEPVYGNTDKLWVASGSKVYQYIKSTNQFDLSYSGNALISRVGVKSIGNQLSGAVLETVPEMAKSLAGKCTANNWCTDTVDFFSPDSSRTIIGSQVYKARILNPDYQ
ncbi:hypothetical protein GCM10010911_72190 [Paenibacillus nasutitermitis]|uniref:Uncharacterized protein n=2 Tax=Paenibacillus nasutitermitis TaxID=1652958 RepID=A0A916ZLV5_9BACL|nr:hypothetical protein GCM10010911_72190 [Paenibacillus nasutitermitis]